MGLVNKIVFLLLLYFLPSISYAFQSQDELYDMEVLSEIKPPSLPPDVLGCFKKFLNKLNSWGSTQGRIIEKRNPDMSMEFIDSYINAMYELEYILRNDKYQLRHCAFYTGHGGDDFQIEKIVDKSEFLRKLLEETKESGMANKVSRSDIIDLNSMIKLFVKNWNEKYDSKMKEWESGQKN